MRMPIASMFRFHSSSPAARGASVVDAFTSVSGLPSGVSRIPVAVAILVAESVEQRARGAGS